MNTFEGIWVPLVTPFRAGRVDLDAAQRLVEHFARSGIAGVVACATTGEAAMLDAREQGALLAAVLEAAAGRLPVVMGLSGAHTAAVVAAARHCNRAAIAAFLVSAPYYVRPSQAGIRQHFEAIAAASDHPIMLYNIPYRTGVNLELGTVQALAANPKFVAIKEAGGGNLDQLANLIRETPLRVLSGEDHMIFVTGCLGGHGAIAAAAHIRPELYARLWRHLVAGELGAARALWNRLLPLVRLLFAEPNPAPVKAALAVQGWIENELRLPMTPVSAACHARLESALGEIHDG